MIRSFRCKDTEALFALEACPRFRAFARVALRELNQLDAAEALHDLRIPPGNRLEPLLGNREGQYSIRINDQWRLCFRWEAGAHDVEIVDYH